MATRLKGLGALIVLTGLVAGLPIVLVQLATQPGFFPTLQRLQTALTSPDDGRLILVLIWGIGWLIWLVLVWLIVIEILAVARGFKAPKTPAFTIPQGLIHALVATTALLFIAAPMAVASPAAADTDQPPDTNNLLDTPTNADGRQRPTNATTVRVEPGDSLWEYAENHLGDGERWPEIYEQNKGIDQPDGGALTNPDLIIPDWAITIPTTQNEHSAGQRVGVTVKPGDTLWSLAEEHLGDGTRWHEIFDRNLGDTQPDAQSLTEPDLIQPGWILTLPTKPGDKPGEVNKTVPVEQPAQVDETPSGTISPDARVSPEARTSPAPPVASATVHPDTNPTPTSAADPTPSEQIADEVLEDSQWAPSWQVNGLIGAGVFLGAGVFTVLHRRRRDQFRHRQPGLTIPTPSPVVAPIEMTARISAGLSRDLLERVDEVLRRTATLAEQVPNVTAVLVEKDGSITLRCEDVVPTPWQAVTGGWTLPGGTKPDDLGETYPDQPAPYPLLVTIGADDQGNTWLLNLEALGIIEVSGDETMRQDFTRYIAAELAVNPWSSNVQVACLGIATETILMAQDRFTTDRSQVTSLAEATTERAHRAKNDAATGRVHQHEDEAWAAVVAFADDSATVRELEHLIQTNPRRTGAAILTWGKADGVLNITASGRMSGMGLDLVAVGLTTDEAAGCAALLSVADELHPGIPVPAADHLTDQTGNLRHEVSLPRHDTTDKATESILPEADDTYIAVAPITATDLQLLAPRTSKDVAEEILERDPDLDRDVEEWFSPNCTKPRLTWLGPVKARCHGKPPTKSRAYYTEVLSYLAAHPNGVTNDQIVDAFNISPQRARTIISNLRQWVGINPATGQPHIPDAKNSPQAIERGVGLYLVQDLLVDADLFHRLRTRAQARGQKGIRDLETALRLVTGRPFDQLRPLGWTWLSSGDRIDHHLTCAVADVAHIVATHHIRGKDPRAAELVLNTALKACPESSAAILDLAMIEMQQGNPLRSRKLLQEAIGDPNPEPPIDSSARTTELVSHGELPNAGKTDRQR